MDEMASLTAGGVLDGTVEMQMRSAVPGAGMLSYRLGHSWSWIVELWIAVVSLLISRASSIDRSKTA